MSAVELADRDQVREVINKPTQPAKAIGCSTIPGSRAEPQVTKIPKQQRLTKIAAGDYSATGPIPTTGAIPRRRISASAPVAKGPVMPMSNRARRPPTRPMAITAPIVPIGEPGMGMKNGRLA